MSHIDRDPSVIRTSSYTFRVVATTEGKQEKPDEFGVYKNNPIRDAAAKPGPWNRTTGVTSNELRQLPIYQGGNYAEQVRKAQEAARRGPQRKS